MADSAAPLLSPLELDAWEVMSHAFQVLPGTLDTQLQRGHGLTYASFTTLDVLAQAPHGEMRLRLLAQRASVSMSRLSHLADRLEKSGYLERRTVAEDRRSTIASITPAGREILAAARVTTARALREMVFEPLDASQVRALREIFGLLHNRMDPERRTPRGLRI